MSQRSSVSNQGNLMTPDRGAVKPVLFTFSKPTQPVAPQDTRMAPEFSLHSPTPVRRHKGSFDVFSPCDNSTVASSRHNNSFVVSSLGSNSAHSRSISSFKKEELAPVDKKEHPLELESIRQKLMQQELRLQTFLKKLKEKETEAADREDRNRKLVKELKESNAQVINLKKVVSDYERQVQTVVTKTTSSLERIIMQKNCEITKLKADLTLLKDQYQAKLEAEVLAVKESVEEKHQNSDILTQELEFANSKIKHLAAKNVQLFEEISGYQQALAAIKARTENGNVYVPFTQVSVADYTSMQQHFVDIEAIQSALVEENRELKAQVKFWKDKEDYSRSQLSALAGEMFKHRCSIAMLARVLCAIKDGETFNLSLLLRSKYESEGSQGNSLEECSKEMQQIQQSFENLENNAVEWYSQHCGDTCKVS